MHFTNGEQAVSDLERPTTERMTQESTAPYGPSLPSWYEYKALEQEALALASEIKQNKQFDSQFRLSLTLFSISSSGYLKNISSFAESILLSERITRNGAVSSAFLNSVLEGHISDSPYRATLRTCTVEAVRELRSALRKGRYASTREFFRYAGRLKEEADAILRIEAALQNEGICLDWNGLSISDLNEYRNFERAGMRSSPKRDWSNILEQLNLWHERLKEINKKAESLGHPPLKVQALDTYIFLLDAQDREIMKQGRELYQRFGGEVIHYPGEDKIDQLCRDRPESSVFLNQPLWGSSRTHISPAYNVPTREEAKNRYSIDEINDLIDIYDRLSTGARLSDLTIKQSLARKLGIDSMNYYSSPSGLPIDALEHSLRNGTGGPSGLSASLLLPSNELERIELSFRLPSSLRGQFLRDYVASPLRENILRSDGSISVTAKEESSPLTLALSIFDPFTRGCLK
jgi:hypothetical protein